MTFRVAAYACTNELGPRLIMLEKLETEEAAMDLCRRIWGRNAFKPFAVVIQEIKTKE